MSAEALRFDSIWPEQKPHECGGCTLRDGTKLCDDSAHKKSSAVGQEVRREGVMNVLFGFFSPMRPAEDRQGTSATVEFEFDGQAYGATVKDLHRHGAKLETESRVPVGSKIRIGRLLAQVVGLQPNGIMVKFAGIVE
jgi:hypothetical protein